MVRINLNGLSRILAQSGVYYCFVDGGACIALFRRSGCEPENRQLNKLGELPVENMLVSHDDLMKLVRSSDV